MFRIFSLENWKYLASFGISGEMGLISLRDAFFVSDVSMDFSTWLDLGVECRIIHIIMFLLSPLMSFLGTRKETLIILIKYNMQPVHFVKIWK